MARGVVSMMILGTTLRPSAPKANYFVPDRNEFSTLVTQLFVEGCIFGQLAETEVMFP